MLLAPPLLGALLAAAVRPYRRFVGWANALLSLLSIGAAVAFWRYVLAGDVLTSGPGEFLRSDALSTLLALCVSLVGALAAWLGPGMGANDGYDAAEARRFRIFGPLCTFTMLFAVTSNNVGFMWIAIEATTITSAMLIPLHVTKASVEASWKYILIGSVGIALAFGGTVLGYFDFVNLVGRQDNALNWTALMASAPHLHPQVIQLAFIFILVGYGTKAGLAPMHTWLPDAHSEAPTPTSAMLSGVSLKVALYALLSFHILTTACLGSSFSSNLLLGFGLFSMLLAGPFILVQQNLKRMLAYSSLEHVGLICVAVGMNAPLTVFGALLHMGYHALTKPVLFFAAGNVHQQFHSLDFL